MSDPARNLPEPREPIQSLGSVLASERTVRQLHRDPSAFVVAAVDGLCRKEVIDLIAPLIPPGLCHESGFRSLVREARQNHQWPDHPARSAVKPPCGTED